MIIDSGLVEGQVLQRLGPQGADVVLIGTASGDGPLHATLFKGRAVVKRWKGRLVGRVARGKFAVKLTAIPVGGPYKLLLEAGGERAEVAIFFVGDVWILAGQSNMQGLGKMSGAPRMHPLVRSFSMRREWRLAQEPLHVMSESPDPCHTQLQLPPEAAEEFRRTTPRGVGVGLFFAHEMVKLSAGVPQGLICVAHGGTSMQQWSAEKKHLGGESMYGSMLLSVRATGQPVAGLLWYQGESDTNDNDIAAYTPRMKALVAATRRDLRQPDLPWVIVQLGRHFTIPPASPISWNSIQEQQRVLPDKIKFLETVVAVDLALDDAIHIAADGYPLLAKRLASAADRLVYGNKREIRPPQFRGIRVIDPMPYFAVEVDFDCVSGALRASGEPTGFRCVAHDGTPLDLIYRTELKQSSVKLYLSRKPVAGLQLFHGHGFTPICNITDARGFPLPVFGPVAADNSKPKALTPFVTQWNVTSIMPGAKKLDQVKLAEVRALARQTKSYAADGFINEHDLWATQTGLGFFQGRLNLSEPMKLEFLMGYDGPFRIWLNEKPFFTHMAGTNPCIADESAKIARLPRGGHEIVVGMDLNSGQAWGFMLRFARRDVTKREIASGPFVAPTYSV